MSKLPSAEEFVTQQTQSAAFPQLRPIPMLQAYANLVLEAAAAKAKWKASTIAIMQHYQDGEADKAGKEFAIEILALKESL